MSAESPSWAEVIGLAMDYRLTDVHTAIPAKVTAYYASTQTVDAQPVVKSRLVDPKGNSLVRDYPPLPNIPVAFPRAGGYFLSLPIAVGDTVLVVFCEQSLDLWRETGTITTPAANVRHGLGGAIAIPGIAPKTSPLADASGSTMRLGNDGGPVLEIDATYIKAGTGASQFVAMANKVLSAINALETAFNAHVHPGVLAGGQTTLVTTTLVTPTTDVASTILKAEG